MRKLLALAPAIALVAAVGCSNTSGNTAVECGALAPTNMQPSPDWQGSVFTIVMENKDQSQIIGNTKDAPFINSLIQQNAVAGGYHDNYVHPSEPNYFWMTAGENFGVLDDNDPVDHHIDSKAHIVDQLEAAGMTWRAYIESMQTPCDTTSHGEYAAKHNPFVFYDDLNGWDGSKFNPTTRCQQNDVDYSQLDQDLASGNLPKYVWITPNLIDDMHDGSVSDGDQWLSRELPKILATDAFNKGGVIFLTWDEGSGAVTHNDDPPMIVISPNAKRGFVSQTPYDATDYLATVQKILGLQQLPCNPNSGAQTMDDLFSVSLEPSRKQPGNPTNPAAAAPGTTTGGTTTSGGTTTTGGTTSGGTTTTGGTTSGGTTTTGGTTSGGTTTGGGTTPTGTTPSAASATNPTPALTSPLAGSSTM